jgi:ABC-2 type transport system ATP-binding protein
LPDDRFATSGGPVIACRGVGKVYRSYRRRPGLAGIWHNFFNRRYEDFAALEAIDLSIGQGELVGLIGANGAGKTTLVKCLTGIVPTTSGRAELFGQESFALRREHKRRLALVMGQRSQLWWDLPAVDSFELLREIYEVPRELYAERLRQYAERLEVAGRLGLQLRQLSLGERMKMELIGAFLHEPLVCFLDEPTIGLDLISQEAIRAFLLELNRERGVTIVLTSHDMQDIESTCRRLLILSAGRLLFDGDLVELERHLVRERSVLVHLEPGGRGWSDAHAARLRGVGAALEAHGPLSLTFSVPAERTQALVRELFDLVDVRDVAIERKPLDRLIKEIYATRGLPGALLGAGRDPAEARRE